MKKLLTNAATAIKWAFLVALVAFVSYFAGPFSGMVLADAIADTDDLDD